VTKTSEPCMCGDTACPTCGTRQGTFGGDYDDDELLLKRGSIEVTVIVEPGMAVVEIRDGRDGCVTLSVGADRQEAITRAVELLEALVEAAQGPAPK